MFLNHYETIYILKPDVTDDMNISLVNFYKKMIKENGGKNIFIQHRGRRHLSYNISHYYDGIYVQMNYCANGDLIQILEKSMRFNENIMRYLTVQQSQLNNMSLYA